LSRRLVPANPRNRNDIESFALSIIRSLQPGVFTDNERFDIERFFDCYLEKLAGVSTDYRTLEDGIYGYTDSDEMVCVISRELSEDPSQEKFYRSTMAHECGHAMMHVKDYRTKKAILRSIHRKDHQLRVYREKDIVTYKNPEWQAWRFAGAILMPESVFKTTVKDGYSIYDLSDRFGVNPAFVRTRLKAFNLNV
jgi:Zn-dependent peptidase ImmA (M78 family)